MLSLKMLVVILALLAHSSVAKKKIYHVKGIAALLETGSYPVEVHHQRKKSKSSKREKNKSSKKGKNKSCKREKNKSSKREKSKSGKKGKNKSGDFQDTVRPPLVLVYNEDVDCRDLDRPLGLCEGDCDDDQDCGGGLVCFIRDSGTTSALIQVPGCGTNPEDLINKDFCVDAKIYQCEDAESFETTKGVQQTCDYVKEAIWRCTEYGIYCRESCGYCRPNSDGDKETPF